MKVKVEMEVEIGGYATDEQIEEFLQFEFGYNGTCSSDNPLLDEDYSVTDFNCEIEEP